MITRLTAAIVGLLAFAGMILAGLAADNPFETVLARALLGLLGGLVVGHVAGHIAGRVIHEQFEALVDRDMDAELATGAAPATSTPAPASPPPQAQTDAATTAMTRDAEADTAQETPDDGRQQQSLTPDQTLSMRAARLMPGPLGDPIKQP